MCGSAWSWWTHPWTSSTSRWLRRAWPSLRTSWERSPSRWGVTLQASSTFSCPLTPFFVFFYQCFSSSLYRLLKLWSICTATCRSSIEVRTAHRRLAPPAAGPSLAAANKLLLFLPLTDVKPSNVLISTQGQVKMCDFGISGYLVDSVAKTMDAGCKPYMAVTHCFIQGGWIDVLQPGRHQGAADAQASA